MSQNSKDKLDLPVLDISTADAQVGRELVDAAVRYGFVFIRNQGSEIPPPEIDQAFELSRKFFSSQTEEKSKYRINPDNRGWSSMHREVLDPDQRKGDYKEAFNFGEFDNGKAQQPLPSTFAAHETQICNFSDRCHHTCLKILRLFALGLEIDVREGGEEWFSSRHKGPSGSILRFLYYPSTRSTVDFDPSIDVRAGAHSDYGSITLLFQRPGQPGLEILTPSGSWSSVPVTPPGTESDASPPILINVGDLLSFWTNRLLRSTVHRVMTPAEAGAAGGQDRYSIAYFCHPMDKTVLIPVPSEKVRERATGVSETAAGSKSVVTAEEHLRNRLAAAYGWDRADGK